MEQIKLHQFMEKLQLFGYAQRTIDDSMVVLKAFCAYLTEKEDLHAFAQLQPEHLRAWQSFLTFEKFPLAGNRKESSLLSAGTISNRLCVVKTFFRVMHQEGLLPFDYSGVILIPKKRKPLPRNIPDVNQMRHILQAAVPDNPLGIRDRFILELLYACGIRNQELRGLSINDLHIQERTLFIRGKGGKDRIVPMGSWVIPYALEYLHAARPYLARLTKANILFLSRNGRMLDSSMLHKIIEGYCQKAGIVLRISPHTFRHACATHMLQAGADIRYVQELLGHRDLSSTQVYTRVSIGDLKQAHALYHPANREEF